jgi:multimeric flavodoxin WrbA
LPDLLAVSSSPRYGGNSELLLDSFCAGASDQGWHVEKVHLNKLKFNACQACDLCAGKGQCVVKDGMQEIYPKLLASQGLVFATPIYFGTVSAQAKMFIDRFQSWWHAKYVLNNPPVAIEEGRKAFFLCVGAMENKEYAENATKVAKIFFHCINHKFAGSLCFRGFDEKGSIKNEPEALKAAYQSGVDFARSYE